MKPLNKPNRKLKTVLFTPLFFVQYPPLSNTDKIDNDFHLRFMCHVNTQHSCVNEPCTLPWLHLKDVQAQTVKLVGKQRNNRTGEEKQNNINKLTMISVCVWREFRSLCTPDHLIHKKNCIVTKRQENDSVFFLEGGSCS